MIARPARRWSRWCSGLWLALLFAGSVFAIELPQGAAPVATPFVLEDGARAWLADHPVIRVGVADGWEPIEFLDEQGQYQGIVADWMKLISKKLGVRFEYVHRESWDAVMDAFYRGEIDILATLTETPERQTRMLFTQPYLNFDAGLVTREDAPYSETLSDLPPGRLAVVKGFASSEAALRRAPHLTPVMVKDTEEALLAVSTGRADVTVITVLVAHYLARQHGLANLRVGADDDDYPAGLAMAVRLDLAPLRDILQAALDSVSANERAAISSRWVDLQQVHPTGLSATAKLALLLLLAGLVIMAGWVYTLRRQIVIGRRLLARTQSAEQRLADIAASAPGVLWQLSRDAQGELRCLYISNVAELTTGIPTAEALGGTGAILATIHPEDQATVLHSLRACQPEQGQHEYRHRLRTRRGRWIAVQVTIAAQQQANGTTLITGFSRDVTAQQRLEADLVDSQQRLRDLAAGVPGALWQFRKEADGRQHYSFMSEGIVGITGRTPEHTNRLMMDKSFVSVYPPDLPVLQSMMQRLTEKPGIEEARYRLSTTEGQWKWVQVAARAMPVEPDGAMVWNGITLDATRIQETEAALRFERQRIQDLADSLSGAIWRAHRTPSGGLKFDYISEGVVRLTGRTAEQIMNAEFSPLEAIVPEDQPRLQAAFDESAESGKPLEIEYSTRAVCGSIERLYARGNVRFENGVPVWTGVLLNVSAQHHLQQQLADVRGRIEDIAANFPGAIFQIVREPGGGTRFTYVSEGITTLTGRPARTSDGRELMTDYNNIHPEDRVRVREASDAMIHAGGAMQLDYRLLDVHGKPRWVHCAMTARTQADGSVLINGLLLNAEEAKRLESELRSASERAETASRTKSRFLANMSHEIRTPMNAVIGLAHIAMTSETNPVQQARIDKIHRAGKALLKLLNDILEYSRLDAGKFTPALAPFELSEVKESLRLFCAPAADTKGLALLIDCPDTLRQQWLGDATRIQQVLLNLLTNAIKFTDHGSVTLQVRPLTIGDGLCFTVSDTGIGMSADEVQRVFEAFEQASGDTERRHGGSGLGLSISRELVTALGGRISVESMPGQGTQFTVELPLRPIALAAPQKPNGDIDTRLFRLIDQLQQRDTSGARNSLTALRMVLLPQGRDRELHDIERLLANFDIESAQIECARLIARWGLLKSPDTR